MYLVVECVEVVVRVHGGLQPDLLRDRLKAPPHSVASLRSKSGSGAQNMEGVVLLVAKRGHVPGQLVQALLDVLVVLCNADRNCNPMVEPSTLWQNPEPYGRTSTVHHEA